jgi:hypothetical protein
MVLCITKLNVDKLGSDLIGSAAILRYDSVEFIFIDYTT